MALEIWGAVLELHTFAAAIVDTEGAIVATNAQATDLWARRPGLFLVADARLALADSNAQEQLSQHLQAADGPPRLAIRLVDSANGALHWVVATALPAIRAVGAASPPKPGDRRFLVSFRLSDEISKLFDPGRLTADLNLTRTEARLAAALAEGLSVSDFAEREGANVKTLRWHLENARRKLDCASQAELVRTVLLVSV